MKALLLFVFAVWLQFQHSSGEVSYSCSHSPLTWCSSVESAIQCGVLKHCLKANFTKQQQTAKPVKIEVYYESLCPDSVQFIVLMLYPSSVLLGDIMDLTLVAYGNAHETYDGKRYIFTCQHGEQECLGNMIEACLLNMTKTEAFLIIHCMEASTDVIKGAKSCVELYAPQLSWNKVMSCVNGDLGNQIMHQNALKTKALNPPHTFVPWVTVNGVHTDELQEKAVSELVPLVCSMYQGPKPAVCG